MAGERSDFRPDIEGLRAIAVMGVLAFHAGVPHMAGGYVGVDVFYVISGFLITGLMLRDKDAAPGDFLASFYARRARRILPAATLVLVATLGGAALVQNALENANIAGDATSAGLFFSNVRFAGQATDYFAAADAPSPFLQYWSLSLEEQFYFVWPLLFVVLCWFGRRQSEPRRFIGAALVVIVGASIGLCILWMRSDPVRAFYYLPSRAWELGIGALVAVHKDRLSRLGTNARVACSIVGVLAIAGSMILYTAATPFPGWTAMPPTFGTALVIAASTGRPGGGAIHRVLGSSPFQLVGRYSFALYLWHWPLLTLKLEHFKWIYATWWTRSAFMFSVSFVLAALTYHVVENPLRSSAFLRAKRWRTLVFALALLALSVLGIVVFQRVLNRAVLSTDRVVASTHGAPAAPVIPTDFVPANLVPALSDTRDRNYVRCSSPCVVGRKESKRRFVLFGNSHAGHWGAAMEIAANKLDARLEVHAPGGCSSFLIPVGLLPTADRPACEKRRERVFGGFDKDPPELVVLSNMTSDVFEKHPDAWERGVRDAIRRIPKQTLVVVFSETPRGKTSIPLCLAYNLARTKPCEPEWPAAANERLKRIAEEEGATYVDLFPLFCVAGRCPAITQDMLIYADGDHITVPYSRARGAWMTETLQALLARRP